MEIKKLAQNTSLLAFPKIIKFFIGIVRAKLVAIYLGTLGAGVVSQLTNILQSISVFTTAGMADGMVRQIAIVNSEGGDKKEIASIIKTYAIPVIFLTILVYALGYIFGKFITTYVFGDLKYYNYFLIGFSALPIMTLSSTSFGLLKAYKKIKLLMFAEIGIIIVNFFVFFALIYFYGLTGAVIYVTTTYLSTFIIYNYYVRTQILNKIGISLFDIYRAKFNKKHFHELLHFVGNTLTAGVFATFVEVTSRSIVVTTLGVDKIGVYSPIIAWSALFTGFILPSLSTYLYPRLSEAKSDKEIVSIVNDVFRLMTYVALPFITIAIVTRNYIIPLFYSKEFVEATIYLPFHFAGLLLVIWNYGFAQIYTPSGRIKVITLFSIIQNIMFLAIVYFLVPAYGLWGWTARYTIGIFISCTMSFTYWYFTIRFRFTKENRILLISIIVFMTFLLIFRDNLLISSILGFGGLTMTWLMLKKKERDFLINKLKLIKFLGRKKN
jgi:O-antigen/teichoic acid export membrane protein